MLRQTGTMINGGVILLVAFLMIWFGIRPAIRAAFGTGEAPSFGQPLLTAEGFDMPMTVPLVEGMGGFGMRNEPNLIEDIEDSSKRTPLKRLEQIVEFDEEQAAAIMKLWMRQKEKA
jgi:flagellar M-ring protein FliF